MNPVARAIVVLAAAAAAAVPAARAAPQAAGGDAADYNRAGALYRDGRFREALEGYESLLAKGIRNPDLFYNAANAAYRSDRLGKAVLYLERARRLSPSDPDILANLEYLNSRKQDREPSPENPVVAYLAKRYRAIGTNRAAAWSGGMFALMMLAFLAALFAGGWRRVTAFCAAGVFGVLFLLWTGILVEKIHHEAVTVEAVIVMPEVKAFSGPGDENTHIFTVHEGTVVAVERMQGEWGLIRLGGGVGGWVRAAGFERI